MISILSTTGNGQYVGYGSPLLQQCRLATPKPLPGQRRLCSRVSSVPNCTADTRAIIEGTAGFWYRFYNGPKGRFRFGTQYSYVTRQTWSGITSAAGVTPVTTDRLKDSTAWSSPRSATTCRKTKNGPASALDAGPLRFSGIALANEVNVNEEHLTDESKRPLSFLEGRLPFRIAAGPVLATLLLRAGGANLHVQSRLI